MNRLLLIGDVRTWGRIADGVGGDQWGRLLLILKKSAMCNVRALYLLMSAQNQPVIFFRFRYFAMYVNYSYRKKLCFEISNLIFGFEGLRGHLLLLGDS